MRFFTIVLLFVCTGCGFLDDDFLLDDEEYEEKTKREFLGFGGMSIYGRGGCDWGRGYGGSSHRKVGSRLAFEDFQDRSAIDLPTETPTVKENLLEVDSRSSFVQLVDSFGAKKHDLEVRLP